MASNGSFLSYATHTQRMTATASIDFQETVMDKITIVLYILTIILGSTGNAVVIWIAGFRMPANVTNVWLVNLAVADFIFCLTRVLSLVKKLFFDHWPFGMFLCKFNGLFKYANMFCSVFLISVISLDRALCVWRPMLTKQHRTTWAARLISVGVWLLAITLSGPYFVFRQTLSDTTNLTKCSLEVKDEDGKDGSAKLPLYLLRFLCGFLFPSLIILSCYSIAALGIRRTRLTRRSKPLKILACLSSAFFLSWAPYHCLLLVKLVHGKSQVVKIGLPVAKGLAYFNSCVNPLLYFCMGLDQNKKLKQTLSGICRRALAEDGDGPSRISREEEHSDSKVVETQR